MSIVPHGTQPKPNSHSSSRFTFGEKVLCLVLAVWAAIVVVAAPAGESVLFGIISPVLGFLPGLWAGFGVGFAVVGRALLWIFETPILMVGLAGAASGIISAWLVRAAHVRSTLGRSFVSALFSEDIWSGNAASFMWSLVVSTGVGYAVSAAMSSMGVFMPGTSDVGMMAYVVLGTGTGGGFQGEFTSWIMMLFLLLGALLVAGAIIGASSGAVIGASAGVLFFVAKAVTQGAAENVAFRFYSEYRPRDPDAAFIVYIIKGAAVGALEGLIAGAGAAAVLHLLRQFSIL